MGELYPEGFTNRWSMGGVSLSHRSPYDFVLQNPASLAYLKQTTFKVGGYNQNRYAEPEGSNSVESANQGVSYLALAFPVDESQFIGGGFSLRPLTRTAFTFRQDEVLTGPDGDSTRLSERVEGVGGLSQFVLQGGIRVSPRLAVGLEGGYVFGSITLDNQQAVVGTEGSLSNLYFISENEQNSYRGWTYQTGVQYTLPIDEAKRFVIGARVRPQIRLKRFRERDLFSRPASGGSLQDTITSSSTEEKVAVLPARYGLAVSYNMAPQQELAIEYQQAQWSTIQEAPFDPSPKDSRQLRLGYAVTPEREAVRGFFKRLNYRFGARYHQTHIEVQGQQIETYAVSFGVGIPLNQTRSSVNFGIEFGQRGTNDNELLRERLLRFQFGLSLNDEWFKSRKIQ